MGRWKSEQSALRLVQALSLELILARDVQFRDATGGKSFSVAVEVVQTHQEERAVRQETCWGREE